MLTITNSATRKKELFIPIRAGMVQMYVCGITPYAPAHIGHGRCYTTFDLVYRLLQFLGYSVTYCRNYTDIDDKLLVKAEQEFNNPLKYSVIADRVIAQYKNEMNALNCLPPTKEPRVTHHIPEIITFIEELIKKGFAYESQGDVYFSIAAFPEYGKLSGQNTHQLRAGERVEVNDLKKDPLDFALWKHEPDIEFWQSPWGNGRPGWHIECSALAGFYLGNPIDIHGGGLDLQFPHHENEVAQSESFHGSEFARYWVHNGFVQVNQEKMSKSLGNVFNLCDLFKTVNPMIVRYYYLTHQYRMPIDFSADALHAATRAYERLCNLFASVEQRSITIEQRNQFPILDKMISLLCDDFNTPGMFGVLFEHLDQLKKNPVELSAIKYFCIHVLGFTLHTIEKEVEITPEIVLLMLERDKARAEKNWKRSDEIRDILISHGVNVQDKKVTK